MNAQLSKAPFNPQIVFFLFQTESAFALSKRQKNLFWQRSGSGLKFALSLGTIPVTD